MTQKSRIASVLSAAMFVMQCFFVPAAHAAMVGTEQELASAERAEKEAQIMTMLEHEKAEQTLARYGVEKSQVADRLNRLSDQEVSQLAQKADEMPAGQDVLGFVLGVILILILLDLLGVTDVFPAIDAAG
jgi:hypothetical protein